MGRVTFWVDCHHAAIRCVPDVVSALRPGDVQAGTLGLGTDVESRLDTSSSDRSAHLEQRRAKVPSGIPVASLSWAPFSLGWRLVPGGRSSPGPRQGQ